MNIYLVRHGQTNANVESRFCGVTNVDLNAHGIQQAKNVAKKLKDFKIDSIYSSDLKRTQKTAEIINAFHDKEIQWNKKLREMNFGVFENLTFEEIENNQPDVRDLMLEQGHNFEFPEGESLGKVYKRANKIFDAIVEENNDQNILIVSHAVVIQSIIVKKIIDNIDKYWNITIDNCSLSTIVMDDDNIYLKELNSI